MQKLVLSALKSKKQKSVVETAKLQLHAQKYMKLISTCLGI